MDNAFYTATQYDEYVQYNNGKWGPADPEKRGEPRKIYRSCARALKRYWFIHMVPDLVSSIGYIMSLGNVIRVCDVTSDSTVDMHTGNCFQD